MEDGLYICKWKKTKNGFKLWRKGETKTFVEGNEGFFVLGEKLSEKITSNGGAKHAVLEFVPPPPTSANDAKFSNIKIVKVSGDGGACAVDNEYDRYFTDTQCPACQSLGSKRNKRPIELEYVEGGQDGLLLRGFAIFSETFLSLLTPAERKSLKLREVICPPRTRKTFFEILGPAKIPYVAIKDFPITGWYCKKCKHSRFGYWCDETDFKEFVAEARVKRLKLPVFTIGSEKETKLGFKQERWLEIVGKRGTKGISSTPKGVASAKYIEKNPKLEERSTQPW